MTSSSDKGSPEAQESPPAPPSGDAPAETRRDFVTEIVAGVLGVILAVTPLVVGLFTFFHPLFGKETGAKDSENEKGGKGGAAGPSPASEGFVRVTMLEAVPREIPQRFAVKSDMVDAWTRSKNEPVGAVYLQRVGDNEVNCFNAICPHAGCFVNCTAGKEAQFACPCHESFFSLDGTRGEGSPSPRDLDKLDTEVKDGFVFVKFQNFYTGRKEKTPK